MAGGRASRPAISRRPGGQALRDRWRALDIDVPFFTGDGPTPYMLEAGTLPGAAVGLDSRSKNEQHWNKKSFNFYVAHGGTNFGINAGANSGGQGGYEPDVTSYDYDAPINEQGRPTPKYHALRDLIASYLPVSSKPYRLNPAGIMLFSCGRTVPRW